MRKPSHLGDFSGLRISLKCPKSRPGDLVEVKYELSRSGTWNSGFRSKVRLVFAAGLFGRWIEDELWRWTWMKWDELVELGGNKVEVTSCFLGVSGQSCPCIWMHLWPLSGWGCMEKSCEGQEARNGQKYHPTPDTRFCSDSNITCFCEESGSLSKVANRPLQFFKVGSSPWSSILALHVFEFTLVDSERIKFFDPKWFPWFQCWKLSIFRWWSDGQGYCVTVRNKYLNSGFARGSVGTRTYLHDPNDPYLHLQDPPGIHWSGDPYTTFFWGTHGNPRNIWRSVNYHVCKLPRGGWKHDATRPTCRIIPVPSPPKSWVQGLEKHLWWCGCGAAGAKVLVRARGPLILYISGT